MSLVQWLTGKSLQLMTDDVRVCVLHNAALLDLYFIIEDWSG